MLGLLLGKFLEHIFGQGKGLLLAYVFVTSSGLFFLFHGKPYYIFKILKVHGSSFETLFIITPIDIPPPGF